MTGSSAENLVAAIGGEAESLGRTRVLQTPLYIGRLAAALDEAVMHANAVRETSVSVTDSLGRSLDGMRTALAGTQNPKGVSALFEAAQAAAASAELDEKAAQIAERLGELAALAARTRELSDGVAGHTWAAQGLLNQHIAQLGGMPQQTL